MFRTTESLYPNVIRLRVSRPRPFARIVSANGQCQDFSFGDLEAASNRAAWFLTENLAKEEERVFYIGPSDIRYLIWIIAAMKTGKCVVCPSPTNTVAANYSLFEAVGATKLIHAPDSTDMLAPLFDATKHFVTSLKSPSFQDLLNKDTVQPYPFNGTFRELEHKAFMGLHTSGTSGHPKPIYWTHGAAATIVSFLETTIRDTNDNSSNILREVLNQQDVLLLFPLFHYGGVAPVLASIQCDNTLVLHMTGTRPTPDNCVAMLRQGQCTSMFLPSIVLEALGDNARGLDVLAKLQRIGYAGGPLNPGRGEKIAKHVRCLLSVMATTEGGAADLISSGDTSFWNACKFVDVGQRMEEIAPGFFELVYPRVEAVNHAYAFFHTHPHLQTEYRTSDLFSPVEGHNDWWIYRGRADNWLMMSNGLKLDPTDMENKISAHPDVKGALVAGSDRLRLCLLVEMKEPPKNDEDASRALDSLWPVITQANDNAPQLASIPKELVIFATREKPFMRASKGSIQRRLTLIEYEVEINNSYELAEEHLLTQGLPSFKYSRPEDMVPFLTELYSQTLDDQSQEIIGIDDDLLARGLDSLRAFVFLARLKATMRKCGIEEDTLQRVDNRIMYTETTISKMATALWTRMLVTLFDTHPGTSTTSQLAELLSKYETKVLNLQRKSVTPIVETSEHTILLTGSTGSLGSYVLSALLARPDVTKVICLNRSESSRERQVASLQSRELPELPKGHDRVIFLRSSLHEPNLGLSEEDYSMVTRETTSIIHNAFPVNFLLDVQSFGPQFKAIVNLIKLSLECPKVPSFIFVSSIAAATPVSGEHYTIAEEVISPSQANHLLPQGYAQAKFICEHLLARAAIQHKGMKTAILRVGQVCGPTEGTGGWNPGEWAPSLVISSKFLGILPSSIGNLQINWVPVDKLGSIVAELEQAAASLVEFLRVYNVTNPKITPWEDLIPVLQNVAPTLVSPSEWIENLDIKGTSAHVVRQNPAMKLVDFYKAAMLGPKLDTKILLDNLLEASATARALSPVTKEDLVRWMKGWGL